MAALSTVPPVDQLTLPFKCKACSQPDLSGFLSIGITHAAKIEGKTVTRN